MKIIQFILVSIAAIQSSYHTFVQRLAVRLQTREPRQQQRGVTAMEYVLIIAVIVIVIIIAISSTSFKTSVDTLFSRMGGFLSSGANMTS